MKHLWDALCRAYDMLGFDEATGGDEVFRQLVLARIIEPTSKQDSLRVLEEAGVDAASYPALNRRLPAYAEGLVASGAGRRLCRTCRAGTSVLVLYDVSTLYFETDQGDGFREPDSPRNAASSRRSPGAADRRDGFPLMAGAFEGNKAETRTMPPATTSSWPAPQLADATGAAKAGRTSEPSQHAIEDAGLSFILGTRIPRSPTSSGSGDARPRPDIPDGQAFNQPWPATGARKHAAAGTRSSRCQYHAHRGFSGIRPNPGRQRRGATVVFAVGTHWRRPDVRSRVLTRRDSARMVRRCAPPELARGRGALGAGY